MALAGNPQVLLADEPTSALDVTVQAQILRLLARLQQARNLAVLLITHDLAVAARVASSIYVLEAGRVVESGAIAEVLARPRSAATRNLLAAARGMAQRLPTVSA
jgi:ABC-type glutathione transport system ATPase component